MFHRLPCHNHHHKIHIWLNLFNSYYNYQDIAHIYLKYPIIDPVSSLYKIKNLHYILSKGINIIGNFHFQFFHNQLHIIHNHLNLFHTEHNYSDIVRIFQESLVAYQPSRMCILSDLKNITNKKVNIENKYHPPLYHIHLYMFHIKDNY